MRALLTIGFTAWLAIGCGVAGWTGQAGPTPTVGITPIAAPTGSSTPAGLAPIVVDAPRDSSLVRSPIRISGSASVFEGSVSVRILDSRGQKIAEGFTTATQGAPGRGTFTLEVPVRYTGPAVIEVFSESARDGSAQFLVRRNVIVEAQ